MYALWTVFVVVMGGLAIAIWRNDGKLWACGFVLLIAAILAV